MRRSPLLTLLILLVSLDLGGGAARAEPGWPWQKWSRLGRWGPCCCPDDYRAKPPPCAGRAPRGCVDDYCPKPPPGAPRAPWGCVDDYCPRPMPLPAPAICGPYHTCGPACEP